MSKRKNVIQRVIAAIFPKKRAAAKKRTLVCHECGATFEGMPKTLTCSKECKKKRSQQPKRDASPTLI
jgi:protein-arginine kinase activator protein McsA